MRLISCHVENFGKLRDFSYDFIDGLNVITEDNGWGKSTMMAFIKAMCYGLVGDGKKNINDNERKKYMPWQGGVFGGKLRFESGGKEYEIYRKWGKKSAEDEVSVIDCSTNLPMTDLVVVTSGNEGSLGRKLFGIDEDSFSRSAFIAQGDVPGGVTSDINAKISNLADNTNDMGNYELAIGTLNSRINELSDTKKQGQLTSIKAELNTLKGEILQEEDLASSIVELNALLKKSQDDTANLGKENIELEEKLDEMTKWQDDQVLRERYKLYDKAMCEAKDVWEAAERKARRDKENDMQVVRLPGIMIIGIVLAVVGIIAAIVGLIMHGEDKTFVIIGATIFVAGIVAAIVGAVMMNNEKATKAKLHDEYLASQGKLDSAYEAYKAAERKLKAYTDEYGDEFLSANDGKGFTDASGRSFNSVSDLSEQIKRNVGEIDRNKHNCAVYMAQISEKQDLLDEMREKKSRLAELEEMAQDIKIKVGRLEMARDMLAEAKINMTAKYIDPLTKQFSHYFKAVTDGETDSYNIDAQSNISVENMGERRDVATLSTGLKDAVGFCLRMALVDAMYHGEKPPIIIDDAFANMDNKNYRGAIRVLAEISQHYQVIYFTCHGDA